MAAICPAGLLKNRQFQQQPMEGWQLPPAQVLESIHLVLGQDTDPAVQRRRRCRGGRSGRKQPLAARAGLVLLLVALTLPAQLLTAVPRRCTDGGLLAARNPRATPALLGDTQPAPPSPRRQRCPVGRRQATQALNTTARPQRRPTSTRTLGASLGGAQRPTHTSTAPQRPRPRDCRGVAAAPAAAPSFAPAPWFAPAPGFAPWAGALAPGYAPDEVPAEVLQEAKRPNLPRGVFYDDEGFRWAVGGGQAPELLEDLEEDIETLSDDYAHQGSHSLSAGIIAGVAIGATVLLALFIWVLVCCCQCCCGRRSGCCGSRCGAAHGLIARFQRGHAPAVPLPC